MPLSLETFPWIHGAADCARSTDPLLQAYQFDANTYIFRVSKCFSYEANFLYLLLGDRRAVLLDTGPAPDAGMAQTILPVRNVVEAAIESRQRNRGDGGHVDLIVAHTHSHGDHTSWDNQFVGRPHTTVVVPRLEAVKSFFGLSDWPEGQNELDLGGRKLIVVPLPGHAIDHIAVYDTKTKMLLTGDTLYPGLLTVRDWNAYRRSAARVADFATRNDVAMVLGTHIEMKKAPRELYPIGTTFQPDEHALPLRSAHIQEWHAACEAMGPSPHRKVHDDFIIDVIGSA
jgi:glyoxylase-like metal-dependent hydrolase (beta-lactamase superfamily II)